MARALTAVGAALALFIGGLAFAVYITRDEDNVQVDSLLSERVTREVARSSSGDGRLDLRQVAPFEWDTVLIVQSGTAREEISRRLGYEWTGTLGFQTGDELILLRGGKVARFFDYRGEGRFAGVDRPFQSLARDQAVFRVRDLVITPEG